MIKVLWLLSISRFYFRCLIKYGKPRNILYCLGGLGDDLCLTVICKAYFLKYGYKPNIITKRPILFDGNPYINAALDAIDLNQWTLLLSLISKITGKELKVIHLAYHHQPINEYPDRLTHKHMLQMMASAIDISTSEFDTFIEDRSPLLYKVSMHGDSSFLLKEDFILIHSSSLSAPYPVKIKEWSMIENDNRFITFCAKYGENINKNWGKLIQIGDITDPILPNTIDLRGRTDLATLALLCKKAKCFIGLEGGIMHFAQSYHTPSIIIYGGRTMPQETGYFNGNTKNLYSPLPCSPCWGTDKCHIGHQCMVDITAEHLNSNLIDILQENRSRNVGATRDR